jgi:hypothetical protein
MTNNAKTVEEYIAELSDDRKEAIVNLRKIISENLPKVSKKNELRNDWFCSSEKHLSKRLSLFARIAFAFLSIASQKNSINIYHMGIYADENY